MKELSRCACRGSEAAPEKAKAAGLTRLELDEKKFRYLLNEDAMATEDR